MGTSTDTQSTTVTFHSPTDNLRLVVKAATRKMNDQGQWETVPGVAIEFRNGRFTTTDSEQVAFLRQHKEAGRLFHELGAERDAVRDDEAAMVAHILDLALEGQGEAIADILVTERNSYSRPAVLGACEKALDRIGAMVPAIPPPPEHQLERVRVPGPVGATPGGFDGSERPVQVGPNTADPATPLPPIPGQPGAEQPAAGQQPVVPPAEGGSQPTVPGVTG